MVLSPTKPNAPGSEEPHRSAMQPGACAEAADSSRSGGQTRGSVQRMFPRRAAFLQDEGRRRGTEVRPTRLNAPGQRQQPGKLGRMKVCASGNVGGVRTKSLAHLTNAMDKGIVEATKRAPLARPHFEEGIGGFKTSVLAILGICGNGRRMFWGSNVRGYRSRWVRKRGAHPFPPPNSTWTKRAQ